MKIKLQAQKINKEVTYHTKLTIPLERKNEILLKKLQPKYIHGKRGHTFVGWIEKGH